MNPRYKEWHYNRWQAMTAIPLQPLYSQLSEAVYPKSMGYDPLRVGLLLVDQKWASQLIRELNAWRIMS